MPVDSDMPATMTELAQRKKRQAGQRAVRLDHVGQHQLLAAGPSSEPPLKGIAYLKLRPRGLKGGEGRKA